MMMKTSPSNAFSIDAISFQEAKTSQLDAIFSG
jgi:hypothetical protein